MKITVENLTYAVGNRRILDHVSACFEGRQICGIIGANGSGKTTLLRHIYRQIPSKNSVFADGTDISAIPGREYARKVAVMMQHQDLYDSDLRVYDVVRTGRYPYKKLFSQYDRQDEEIVTEIMREHALMDYRNRRLSTLSGGELQRVMICRCLAQQPETIILDEPTNHLDIRYKLELMKTLQSFGGLVIMTLHDLNLAAGFCDVIFVLKDGQVIARGAPGEIFTREMLRDVFQADIELHTAGGRIYIGV